MPALDAVGEVGRYGLVTAGVTELLTILGVLVAWKFSVPFNDMKTPFLRIPIRLSEPPRKLWDFKKGVCLIYGFVKGVCRKKNP
jgi:hypothetical protein